MESSINYVSRLISLLKGRLNFKRGLHYPDPGPQKADAPQRRLSGGRHVPQTAVYDLLDEEALQSLETHAEWILREIGIEFRGDEEALRLFKNSSAAVKRELVHFDTGLARALCSTAPRSFRMVGRDPASSITFGGEHVIFSHSYGPPFVTDLEGFYVQLAELFQFRFLY